MSDNQTINSELKNIVAAIMQSDVQVNGPVSDDPREAYVRGIEAALMMLGVTR